MLRIQREIELRGGLASRRELLDAGCIEVQLDILAAHGRLVARVRRGWYALPGTRDDVLRAWRVGGRLACVSAVRYHEGAPSHPELHVLVNRGASRLRPAQATAVVLPWSRNRYPGDRAAVDLASARRQASRCEPVRAVASARRGAGADTRVG